MLENDLVFVAANPGISSRLATQAQLAFYQNVQLPIVPLRLMSRIEALRPSGRRERKPSALFSLANSCKSAAVKLLALKDEHLSPRKRQFEKRLRNAVDNDPKLGAGSGQGVGRGNRRVPTVGAEREGVPGVGAAGGAGLATVPVGAHPGAAGRGTGQAGADR